MCVRLLSPSLHRYTPPLPSLPHLSCSLYYLHCAVGCPFETASRARWSAAVCLPRSSISSSLLPIHPLALPSDMLLSKQPGDTGIYATATSSQVRLYYVLDRVFPVASSRAVAAEGSDVLGNAACDGFDDIRASATTQSLKPVPPDLMPYFAGAPACVPREYLRMLCRLSAVGRGTGSVAAATTSGVDVRAGGYDDYGLPAPLATSAARVRFPPPPRTGVGYASATSAASDDWLQKEQQRHDLSSAYHWGAPLVPFHTVSCGGGVGAGEGRLLSSHGGASASLQEWATPTLAAAGATSTFTEECGPGQASSHVSGNSAAWYSGYYTGGSQTLAGRAGGGGGGGRACASSTASAAAVSTAPTALSLSCATDCVLFFVANAEGLSWIGRSDATALSPLRVSTSLPMRRRGTGGYGGPSGGGGGGTVVSSASHPPQPFSEGCGAPVNATFSASNFSSSEQTATPPNMAGGRSLQNAPVMVSDEDRGEGSDDDKAGEAVAAGTGGGGVADNRRRPSLAGAAAPSFTDGLDVYGGVVPAAMAGLPMRRAVSRHDRVVTASGWDPRNSAILALGRQSGAVQLLDVEYVVGSVEGRCCSPTTTSRSTSNDDTNELLFVPAGASALGGSSVCGTRLVPYAGADHLSYSVVQQKQMLGPVTALDWMPQSHLTVVAARRLDGLGFYAELLDLRASHDGVTYLGAPPEVFGVPVCARTTDNAAPCVLCSAEQVACHPSQRYVATVGASQMQDIVQLWDVRMATRPVSCQVHLRAGYTSLCWSAAEAGVVLGTTRDGGLRAHAFKELAPSRAAPGGPVVVTSHHYGSAANSHLSPSGFGSGGAGGGFGTGRSRRRRAPSGGLPHHRSPSGGELEADGWGVSNSNPVNSGCSGTEAEADAEEDFTDDSCSIRSGFSGDGTGAAMPSITDGSNALVHVSVKAQSALKCRLPSRVPAAAVGWVCHPLSESMKTITAGSIPGLASVHRRTSSGMSAAGPHHSERLHTSHGATSGLRPTDDCDGEVDDNAMARGCRTDLPQLLLLNAKNGELYTQVYNPGGSTVTSLDSSTALVGAGPNAFLTHASTAYKTASYVYEEAVLDRLECQAAAAAAAAAAATAAASAAAGMAVPSRPTPIPSGSASKAGMGLLCGRAGAAGAATVTSTHRPHISGDSTADGAQLLSNDSSATDSGRACTAAAAAAARGGGDGVATAEARLKGRPVDLIGLGLLDEVEDENDDEEGERDTLRVSAAAAATGDYEHCVLAGANTNGQQLGFGAASSTPHSLSSIGAAGTAGVGGDDGSASAGSPRAGLTREAASSSVCTGGAAAPKAPKGVRCSGISGALQEEEGLLGRRASLREPVAASPHSQSTSAELMQQPYIVTTSAGGRGAAQSATAAAAAFIPQEMSFCEFHRLDRTRHLWRRLRSGFSYDPVRNLTVLLREGLDREAYATFLYGCCAAQLLFPAAVMVAPKSRSTDPATGPAASAPSLVVGLKRAVPGLLELLVSERELRQQLRLSDTRFSSQFPLSQHHHQLASANATAAGEAAMAAGFAPPSGYAIVGPIGALGLQTPLLAGLSSAMERHKGPPGLSLHPFSAVAAGIRAGRPPPPAHLTGPAINAGVSHTASSVLRGSAGSPGAAGGAAGDSAAYLPMYPVAIGMLRQLVLQSMGWTTPPAVCLVDPPAEHTTEREGTSASAAAARAGGVQATRSPPPRGDHRPQHPAERFFVQGDGIGQRNLQEALERRVAVLVLLDRLEEAAELLALYGTRNAQYPSIALTLSAARGRQTTVMSLAADDCPGVTFWIHLMLTYMELVMHQQSCGAAAAEDRTLPADAGSSGSGSDDATSSTTTSTAAATEPVSRFDDLFTLPQQKAVVLRLLERYPRLVLSDKVALATALLLPSRYHSGHVANLLEVLQALVQQQYRDYSSTATASTAAQQAVADSTYGSPSSASLTLGIRARQQRRVDSKRTSLSGLPRSPAQNSSVDAAVSPAALGSRFPSPLGVPPVHGSVDSHYSDPSDTFVLAAAASAASADRFAPIHRCSLLLVTVVEGVSTDCGALQRYVDESGDVQTALSYAAAFSNVLSPTVHTWRDAYRRLLNDQGLAMWRSLHDLHIVKLLKAREEADKHGGGSATSGSSNPHSAGAGGGVAGVPGGPVIGGGGGSSAGMAGAGTTRSGGVVEATTGASPGSLAGAFSGAGVPRPNGFPGALGSLGSDLGTGPGAASAAAMMSTQTAMMMERTLNRFAQTTATATTDRDRSLREAAATAGGASQGANEALHRSVELRCNCGQAMHATAPSKSTISSMTSTNMTRKQLIPCGNPECRQWQSPMCTVCGERMEHRATELPPERFFAWCSVCLHGGHWCHLREWFSKHTKCPVENCPCRCCDNVHLS
ncbi:conserved hypothetical protein [Leishmania major strain Friedlin]|uniref:Uncharacterized protein n=1 Tax=Leishmania major TaxID=5664 RepID=Q4Q9W7_LEIMA|nr:conserved hypothetical protein [Leishmania major strain Friedlin]CAG9575142.1 hypothetical_protein_-_conserved [Leishmania major strain Friedlin]CAJ05204.1 conserved hypothetical protein [Leishmania major strain Friedlin]|eukprot:XP_001683881.1 conserved hypothetical protein [Leishmania major strain Friedlin]